MNRNFKSQNPILEPGLARQFKELTGPNGLSAAHIDVSGQSGVPGPIPSWLSGLLLFLSFNVVYCVLLCCYKCVI